MVGQIVGSYRIVRRLGEGGMGAVFEGVHTQLGRRAAIKVLHRQLTGSEEMAARFFNEARSVNMISHSGIVDVSEFGQLPDGTIYIVMEFLEGESLRRRMEQAGALDPISVSRLGQQIAASLAAAHHKGIVHRDLNNIFFSSRYPLLAKTRECQGNPFLKGTGYCRKRRVRA